MTSTPTMTRCALLTAGLLLLLAGQDGAAELVRHTPLQPRSGEAVQITATITQAIKSVTLEYQVVDPGNYIELKDPAYTNSWVSVAMASMGRGRSEFNAKLPAAIQKHRRLVRYRVVSDLGDGKKFFIPDRTDTEPNFAYFVYDAVPSWRGAIEPGSAESERSAAREFSSKTLQRLPVYHLIAKKSSIEAATWTEKYAGDEYKWVGTFVCDGKVYDHIRYRPRGGVWRFAMGKNMWKFAFNKGHEFPARDNYGQPYSISWSKLNLGACIQQGQYGHRGEHGMFEAVGFKLFNLAGVESPLTHWVHFRVIEDANEANPTNQYVGDFWGLYLAVENEDRHFLREHHLPNGNLFKMEGGTGEIKNVGVSGVTNRSDLDKFLAAYSGSTPSDEWWRANLDLPRYYSYRSIIEGIHHYDIGEGKNYFYFLNPDTRRWSVHPWDLDLTWANSMYGSGEEPFKSRVLSRPAFRLEYQNRLREIRDLLFNTNQTWMLIDEFAHLLTGGADEKSSFVAADRARWDYAPVMSAAGGNAGEGGFYRMAGGKDFAGMVQLMKVFVRKRSTWIDTILLKDAQIPSTPTVRYSGRSDFASLAFDISEYKGENPFAAVQWRIAEVTPSVNASSGTLHHYEVDSIWQSAALPRLERHFLFPDLKLQPGSSYRARARVQDNTGRWSHWSLPFEFAR